MVEEIYVCKLCAQIVKDENKLLNHIVEKHNPSEFFTLSFMSEWSYKKPEKKKATPLRRPVSRELEMEEEDEEGLVIE